MCVCVCVCVCVCLQTAFRVIVFPLAVKNEMHLLELAHRKECITLQSSQIYLFFYVGAFPLHIFLERERERELEIVNFILQGL